MREVTTGGETRLSGLQSLAPGWSLHTALRPLSGKPGVCLPRMLKWGFWSCGTFSPQLMGSPAATGAPGMVFLNFTFPAFPRQRVGTAAGMGENRLLRHNTLKIFMLFLCQPLPDV